MEFNAKQKLNISNIICNQCKLNNKGESYNHDFYNCLTCKINLCPLCKTTHEKNHNIIKYEEQNYICPKHNDSFFKYCQDCKMNICIMCEKEHKEHKMIFFGDIIPNIDELKNQLIEKKKEIDSFKENIKKVLGKLNDFLKIIDTYIDINNEMLDNYDIRKKNYVILSNISEINYNNDIFKKLRDINDMGKKILDVIIINEEENMERKIEKLKIKLQEIEEENVKRKRKEESQMDILIEKEKENIINKTNFYDNLKQIMKKVCELNIHIKAIKRNIKMEVILLDFDKLLIYENDLNPRKIMVRVENYEEGSVYYWNQETFYKRYDLFEELYKLLEDGKISTIFSKEDDPLWDKPKHHLLGYAFYLLEPLCYLMSNRSSISIISPQGDTVGQIDVDIITLDENDNEFEEVPESPSELIGQSLAFKVLIIGVKNLPKNFCRNLKVEYQTFYDKKINSTKIYNENDSNLTEFKIGEKIEHKIDYLTKEDIEYLEKEKLRFEVYAFEEVEKKGKQLENMNESKMELNKDNNNNEECYIC